MRTMAISLGDIMRGMGAEGDEQSGPRPLPEAQVATLREAFERYSAPCAFKPGDLVTPRKGFNVKCVGDPHIVIEVFGDPIRNFAVNDPVDTGLAAYGSRMDMRVVCFAADNSVAAFMSESWKFEKYAAG